MDRTAPSRECLAARMPRLYRFLVKKGFASHVAERAVLKAVSIAERYLDDGRADQLRHHVAWLYTVAYRAAVRIAATERSCISVDHENLDRMEAREDSSERAAILAPVFDHVLAMLSPQQRQAVSLYYLSNLSMRKAAAAMGISRGAFGIHVRRGLAHLRVLLPGFGLGGSGQSQIS
jgi:RNA polymerase sigma factor (sigma-70 family)